MVRSCPGDTGGLLGRLDMAFWRQKLMNNTSNLLYRYKKRAQDEVLTTCIALQLGGGWGANGVGHETQGAATKNQNFNIFKCSNCTDEVDFTQNLCLCLLSPLEFKSASEKFPIEGVYTSTHCLMNWWQKQQFLGSKSRPLHVQIWNIQSSVSFCHAVLQGWS